MCSLASLKEGSKLQTIFDMAIFELKSEFKKQYTDRFSEIRGTLKTDANWKYRFSEIAGTRNQRFFKLLISESNFEITDFINLEINWNRATGKPISKWNSMYILIFEGQAREKQRKKRSFNERLRKVATVPKINGQYLVLFLGCFLGENRPKTTMLLNHQTQDSYAGRV